MTVASPLFFKAVATISKQQRESPTTPSGSTTSTPKGKKRENPGTFLLSFIRLFLTHDWILDPLSKFLDGSDGDMITRARDVVANSIMAEIAKEDPQGQTEYQDAVRHHIVAFLQRLRVSLLVLDKLMDTYNTPA